MFDIDKVRAIREQRGLTQQQLATLTGIPLKTLVCWEQHRSTPKRINDLNNIAIVLDCYLDDFLEDGKHLP